MCEHNLGNGVSAAMLLAWLVHSRICPASPVLSNPLSTCHSGHFQTLYHRAVTLWSRDPDSTANYSLAVTFEILGQQIQIYDVLRTAVIQLQELEAEAEIEAEEEVEVEE